LSDTAFQTMYRQEFIAGFEQRQSLLRMTCTTEAEVNGNTAVFLVGDSGSAQAVTRGVNGLIPGRADNLTQNSCVLAEWHDKPVRTGFNLYASQGDGRRLMQETSMGVLNRKIDSDIIVQLDTATQDTGAAATGSLDLAMFAYTILGNNDVEDDGNIFAAITPAFRAYLMKTKEFASADYTKDSKFDKAGPRIFKWAGVTWIVSTRLTGKGTAAEKCYMYHKSAIGHACDMERLKTHADYNAEHDYSYCLATGYFGSKLLQNSGIVQILHDGSAFAAQ
jgi:hypothetical protein